MPLKHEKPSKEYMRELKATAKAAAAFKDDLARFNMLPNGFPCEQINDFCDSLIGLPNGTAEGSIAPLRSSDNELNRIRQSFIPAYDEDEGGEPPLIERSSNLDNKLIALMAAVRSAIERYKIESGDELHTDVSPELSNQPDTGDERTEIADEAAILESDAHAAKTAFKNSVENRSQIDTELRLLSDVETGSKSASGAVKTDILNATVLDWIADSVESTANALEARSDQIKIIADEISEGCAEQVEIWFPKITKSGKALYARMKKLSHRLENEGENEQKFTAENFDYVEVYNRLLRGEAVPDAWAPMVKELDFWQLLNDTNSHHLDLMTRKTIDGDPTKFEDTGLFANCINLQSLYLSHTNVKDLSPFSNFRHLEIIRLTGTNVEDLSPLSKCFKLRWLSITATPVRNISVLNHLRPKLTITGLKVGPQKNAHVK